MVDVNTYTGFKIWFRYYFSRFLPKMLYPFFAEYFYRKYCIKYIKCKYPRKLADLFNPVMYYEKHGFKKLNLANPKTFTDKLNYLKLYDVTKEKTMLTDKLLVKEYVKKVVPELNIAKVYQSCNSFDELNFNKCPEKFIIKTNHACKTGIVIFHKKVLSDEKYLNKIKKYYKKVLNINYAYWGIFELQYKDIKPQIYTEELLIKNENALIEEYEVYCINSNPEFMQYNRSENGHYGAAFYNADGGEECNFSLFSKWDYIEPPSKKIREKILNYARILSQNFKFVRVDLFVVDSKIYFGEMTFTPFTGNIIFTPCAYNDIYGKKLVI